MRLSRKTVLVTGGASGIGAAVCQAFAREGARVAVVDRDYKLAVATASSLNAAVAFAADVSSSSEVDEVFAAVERTFGHLHGVVHAAGVDDPAVKQKFAEFAAAGERPLVSTELTDEAWHRVLRVNLDGAFFVIRAALRLMVPHRHGTIVTISSVAGVEGTLGYAHYAASKGGILAMTRSVAKEVAPFGIRVNAIAPGVIETPMSNRTPSNMLHPNALPSRRFGRASEIADAALFLSTDASSYVVGETMTVAGGALTV